MTTAAPGIRLTRTHKALLGVAVVGAIAIAGIGFAGSYAAVRELAERKHFGDFAAVFPIGLDAGIGVLLVADLVLAWLRMAFPMLRQTAWLLTVATIAFNAAAAWPDPLGVGMHAVIPVLFIIVVEAARHAVARMADLAADRDMESIRWSRWLLAPWPTFRLWRRMVLWEIRSYGEAVAREQQRLVYRAKLRAEHGWAWRWSAPLEARMPLRMARYGVPVDAPAAALEGATERHVDTPQGATEPATVAPQTPATERPQGATEHATADATERPQGATETRHRSASKTPRKAPSKRPQSGSRSAAKDAIKALYTDLGRRPLEGEMVGALVKAKARYTSRQYAQKLRAEIEQAHPELAALGSDNVRALTG